MKQSEPNAGTAARVLHPESHAVLAKALVTAGRDLGLTQAEIGAVIGRDRTALSRAAIDPSSKSGELALLLIRAYRALYVLVGGEPAQMRHWWRTPNRHLDGAPVDLIRSVQGLLRVVEYLDAMRGKL